jgi:hypothetical protein
VEFNQRTDRSSPSRLKDTTSFLTHSLIALSRSIQEPA